LRTVNAGHPPGLLWRAATQSIEQLEHGGIVVGLFVDECYRYDELTLAPGDTLVMYTDGIIECKNTGGELYGIERLHACFARLASGCAGDVLQGILDDIGDFHQGVRMNDDVTIVVVKAR
jgi:phosphoserine phosphatase RsbU/P